MQIDQHILIRYFLKQASEEEKEVIRQWIGSSEDNRRCFIRERIRFDASILVDEAAVESSTKIASGKRFRLHPALTWSLKVAASILILLGSFISMTITGSPSYRRRCNAYMFQLATVLISSFRTARVFG